MSLKTRRKGSRERRKLLRQGKALKTKRGKFRVKA
jgi:hypothetical protein